MKTHHHLQFGEIYCEEHDLPGEYRRWAVFPDYSFLTSFNKTQYLLHRFTWHYVSSFDNADPLINVAKNKYPELYSSEDRQHFRNMIHSHMYLDLFNSVVFNSLPNPLPIEIKSITNPIIWWKYERADPQDVSFDDCFRELAQKDELWYANALKYPEECELTEQIVTSMKGQIIGD